MIWTALFLLVVSAILLVAGIVRSSFGLLLLSFGATVISIGLLYASFRFYRNKAVLGPAGDGAIGVSPGYPESYGARVPAGSTSTTVVEETAVLPAVVPAPAAAGTVLLAPVPVPVPVNGSAPSPSVPVADWDHLDGAGAVAMVEALNLDELFAVRRHEIEHDGRPPVLRAIDTRVDHLVALRKSITGK